MCVVFHSKFPEYCFWLFSLGNIVVYLSFLFLLLVIVDLSGFTFIDSQKEKRTKKSKLDLCFKQLQSCCVYLMCTPKTLYRSLTVTQGMYVKKKKKKWLLAKFVYILGWVV